MAIQDRNLSVGTRLYARYKGTTYTSEVVLNPEATGDRPIAYKVEGKEQLFKSPSAAGTAVTGLACNGWAFWSVGDGSETKPAKSETAVGRGLDARERLPALGAGHWLWAPAPSLCGGSQGEVKRFFDNPGGKRRLHA